jgi:peptide/nickel transport system substrate-binding protein
MWQLTPAQARAVTADQRLQVVRSESMRVFYLAFDAAGRGGLGIPFTRLDVRRAACHAIDRDALASDAAARPAIAPCAPTQFACDASVAVRYDHDPGQSRALLAAAGFPDGIDTELVTDAVPALARAVAADLAEGGFRARLTILPAADALARVAAGTAPLFLGSWGSSSINDISAFLPPFFEFGPLDTTRDSQLASLLAEAELAADPEQRRGLYQQAIQRITDQAFFLPLFVDPSTYGIARRLVFRPTPDELPRFYQMAWR